MQRRHQALVACLSLLAACGSDSTAPAVGVSGTVTFTYTGAGGGSYSATGSLLSTANQATAQTTTWSTGWKDNTDNSTNVFSNVPTTAALSNYIGIIISGQTSGAAPIVPTCQTTTTTSCTSVVFFTGFNANAGTWTYLCVLESGTVTIASISATNATGSFSGTGTCLSSALTASAFTITNGSFNVPLLANIPTGL